MKSDHLPDAERAEPEPDATRLDRLVPEIVRRLVEASYLKLSEGPGVRRVVSDLRLPKEALVAVLSQLDETRAGVYRVVSREVREFLERTSVAEELTRALTSLSLEITTSVRFVPNAAGEPAPDVRSRVSVRRQRDSAPPPDPAAASPVERPADGVLEPSGERDREPS